MADPHRTFPARHGTTGMLRRALALCAVCLACVPAPTPLSADTGCWPLAPGCERLPRLLDDLTGEIAPLLDDLAARLNPYLRELGELLGDLSGWEAPQVLPNGDILIRRRPAAPPPPPDQSGDDAGDGPVTVPFEL